MAPEIVCTSRHFFFCFSLREQATFMPSLPSLSLSFVLFPPKQKTRRWWYGNFLTSSHRHTHAHTHWLFHLVRNGTFLVIHIRCHAFTVRSWLRAKWKFTFRPLGSVVKSGQWLCVMELLWKVKLWTLWVNSKLCDITRKNRDEFLIANEIDTSWCWCPFTGKTAIHTKPTMNSKDEIMSTGQSTERKSHESATAWLSSLVSFHSPFFSSGHSTPFGIDCDSRMWCKQSGAIKKGKIYWKIHLILLDISWSAACMATFPVAYRFSSGFEHFSEPFQTFLKKRKFQLTTICRIRFSISDISTKLFEWRLSAG